MTNRLNRLLLIIPMTLLFLSCGGGDGSGSSGDGGEVIAFSSFRDSRSQIYLMDADGSGQRNISNSNALDNDPAWSPDGKRIAFTSSLVLGADPPTPNPDFPEDNAAIYVMNADGSNQQNISNNFAFNYDPAWSPNGNEIAFASRILNGQIWLGASVAPGNINRWDLNGQPIGGSPTTQAPVSAIVSTGSEIWVGSSLSNGTVNRYEPDGVAIASFETGWPIAAMVLVRGEVWIGSSVTPGLIRRCDASPTSSGQINCDEVGPSGSPISAMVFDGNTIWTAGGSNPGTVTRFDRLSGDLLTTSSTGAGIGAMVLTNDEVWTGGSASIGAVNRFDLEGNFVASFNSNTPVGAMVFTGTEVWTGGGSGVGPVTRFDLAGSAIESFNAGAPVLAIARSQDQIWVATSTGGGTTINRYLFNGDLIGPVTADDRVGALAFVPSGEFSYRIAVMNPDGSNQRTLFSDPRFGGKPTWSPDSSQIAFYSFADLLLPAGDISQIFVMDSDGQNRENISESAIDNYEPAWSPDGSQIAFVSEIEGLAGPPTAITTGRLFYGVQTATGALFQAATSPTSLPIGEAIPGGAKSITVSAENETDFAAMFDAVPAGQNLYFVESTYVTAFPAQGVQIPDTSVNLYLVLDYDAVTNIADFGRQGSVASQEQIYLMNTNGSNQRNISNSPVEDSRPAWSPDGNQIVFSSFRDGNSQIYMMDVDGSNRQNISNNAFSNSDPSWKP